MNTFMLELAAFKSHLQPLQHRAPPLPKEMTWGHEELQISEVDNKMILKWKIPYKYGFVLYNMVGWG